jgi:hypothetical protein
VTFNFNRSKTTEDCITDEEFLLLLKNQNILEIVDSKDNQDNKSLVEVNSSIAESSKLKNVCYQKRKSEFLIRSPIVTVKKVLQADPNDKTNALEKLLTESIEIFNQCKIFFTPGPNKIYTSKEIEIKRIISALKFNITKIKRLYNFK